MKSFILLHDAFPFLKKSATPRKRLIYYISSLVRYRPGKATFLDYGVKKSSVPGMLQDEFMYSVNEDTKPMEELVCN